MFGRSYTPGAGAISFGSHRYQAQLDRVVPERAIDLVARRGACLFAVALGNPDFEGARLQASIEWISASFGRCGIVVGGTVYRLALALLDDVSEADARERALAAGHEFVSAYAPLFRQYADRCTFEVVPFPIPDDEPRFAAHLAQLTALAASDPGFISALDHRADRHLGIGEAATSPEARDSARAYLLEEASMYATLCEQDWPIIVSVGPIESIADMAEGGMPGVPESLGQIAQAALTLRKRGLFFADGAPKVIRKSGDEALAPAAHSTEFLPHLDDDGWDRLFAVTTLTGYATGDAIMTESDTDRRLCLLLHGRAEVTAQRPDGSRQQIAVIEEGTVIGEQSFLDGLPRSAHVTALSPCSVRTLDPAEFEKLKHSDPELALALISDIGRVLSLRSRRMLYEMQKLP